MTTITKVTSETDISARFPFTSFPTGWFVVEISDKLPYGKVLSKKIFDEDVVLFRTLSGTVNVMDAHCPHLGAHLGYGGRVEGESIRCPFHGLCFNSEGDYIATGCGKKVPKILPLKKWKACEMFGVIFVWYNEEGKVLPWEMPNIKIEKWSSPRFRSWTLRTQPQEISENGVDIGHFNFVHGFDKIEIIEKVFSQDHVLRARYAVNRQMPLNQTLCLEFEINMYGLGWSLINIFFPKFCLHVHYIVSAIPIDKNYTHIIIRTSIGEDDFNAKFPLLRIIPQRLIKNILSKIFMNEISKDIAKDFDIWENKKYIQSPRLTSSDVSIATFRQWSKQFYSIKN